MIYGDRSLYHLSLVRMSIGQFPPMANCVFTVLQITEQDSGAAPSAGPIGGLCRLFLTATQHPPRSLLHGGTVRCSHPPFRRDQRHAGGWCSRGWHARRMKGEEEGGREYDVAHSVSVRCWCARGGFFSAVRQDRRRRPHSLSSMLVTVRCAA